MKKLACGAVFSIVCVLLLTACGSQATPVVGSTSNGSPLSPVQTVLATVQSRPTTATAGTATTAAGTTAAATTTSAAGAATPTSGTASTPVPAKTVTAALTPAKSAISSTRPPYTSTPAAGTPTAAVTDPSNNYLTLKYSTPVLNSNHSDPINTAVFSPDNKMFATGASDHSVKLWDAATGNLLLTYTDFGETVMSLAFSPDGKLLAVAGLKHAIKIFDTSTGKTIQTLDEGISPDYYSGLSFSKNGKLFGGAYSDSFKVWDTTTWKLVQEIKQPSTMDFPHRIVLSSDGKLVGLGDVKGNVEIWDTSQNNKVLAKIPGSGNSVFMRFTSDDKTFIGGDYSWDIAGGKVITKYPELIWGLSADNSQVIGYNKTRTKKILEFFNLTSPTPHTTIDISNSDVTNTLYDLNSDFSQAILSVSNGLEIFSKSTGKPAYFINTITTGTPMAINSDGSLIASIAVSTDSTKPDHIQITEAASGSLLNSITLPAHESIKQMDFSPDGTKLAAGNVIWDVKTGNEIVSLKTPPSGSTLTTLFSPDGKFVVTADYEGTVYLADSSGNSLTKVDTQGKNDIIYSVTFSPDSKKLAVNTSKGIQVIDLTASQPTVSTTYGFEYDTYTAWSADQKYMLIVDDDSIYQADLNDSTDDTKYPVEPYSVVSEAAYSLDGKTVFGLINDIVIGWDRNSGMELFRTPLSATPNTTDVAISPDGKTLYTAQADGSVKAWRLP